MAPRHLDPHFFRKWFKRLIWRFRNMSFKQFVWTFVFRQIRTIKLDQIPTLFPSVPELINLHDGDTLFPRQFFVLIKPSGIAHASIIKNHIRRAGLNISREVTLNAFFHIAYHLFHIPRIKDYWHGLPEGHIWLHLLERIHGAACQDTIVLYLENGSQGTLEKLKNDLRKKIGVVFFRVIVGKKAMVTCLTPIHTPDEKDLDTELKILDYFEKRDVRPQKPPPSGKQITICDFHER